MSIRYGISLVLDPAFTALLHRARQVVCSQYGCWAAEMHAVHVPLTGYFPCPEVVVPTIAVRLGDVAENFQEENRLSLLAREDAVAVQEEEQGIFVEFAERGTPRPIEGLRQGIAAVVSQGSLSGVEYTPSLRFPLLQYALLSPQAFRSAAGFAQGVVDGLAMGSNAPVSELALFRYESNAAGEDWAGGGWAADLSWQIVSIHSLTASG